MKHLILATTVFLLACFVNSGCKETSAGIPSTYHYIEPTYQNVQLLPQSDSLHFPLGENSLNSIGSFNYFIDKGKPFISFYDQNAKSLNTYDFTNQQLIQKIPLKKWFISENFKKVSSYVVNFDSIFFSTDKMLFLMDSSGVVKNHIEVSEALNEKVVCVNDVPAILNGSMLFMGVRPVIRESSLEAHKQFKVLCGFNLNDSSKKLYYQLPDVYRKNLWGYSFLDYSFCQNDRGNFVFSFPADSNIYETNLADLNNAYFGKSQFQKGDITPIPKEAIGNSNSFKEYCLRDSYGCIFYDPHRKRYLREAKQRLEEKAFLAKDRARKRTLLIFDEHFKIIGESISKEDKMVLKSIFFTADGRIYARVKTSDEHALHFVRLDYDDNTTKQAQLTQASQTAK